MKASLVTKYCRPQILGGSNNNGALQASSAFHIFPVRLFLAILKMACLEARPATEHCVT